MESMWTEHPASPPGWAMEEHEQTGSFMAVNKGHWQSSDMSCQRDGDSAVGSTAATSVDAGLCELLAVFLWLLVCDGG